MRCMVSACKVCVKCMVDHVRCVRCMVSACKVCVRFMVDHVRRV